MVDARRGRPARSAPLLAGGEALSPAHVRRALERLPRTRSLNGYGPTEVIVLHHHAPFERARARGRAAVPIGRPIDGARVYVLDARRSQPVPRGACGELFAAGDGLARGYLERRAA